MSIAYSVIETIVNSNFGNTFHHQNGPNQRQRTHKNFSEVSIQNLSNTKDPINSISKRRLYCMCTQQQRIKRFVNASRWKIIYLSLQRTICCKEKVSHITAPSVQSQKWIKTQIIQQKH